MLLSGVWSKSLLKRNSFKPLAQLLSASANVDQLITMEHSLVKKHKAAAVDANVIPQIHVKIRNLNGSRQSRWLRRGGQIPGVLHGIDDEKKVLKANVIIDQKKLLRELRSKGKSFENTLYELVVEEETESAVPAQVEDATNSTTSSSSSSSVLVKHLVLPRQTQFDPLTDLPVSVNFLKYHAGVKVRVPFSFINEDQNVELGRNGSYVLYVNRWVEVLCEGKIPHTIPVDLSKIDPRHPVVRLSMLELPTGIRPHKAVNKDYVICILKFGRKD